MKDVTELNRIGFTLAAGWLLTFLGCGETVYQPAKQSRPPTPIPTVAAAPTRTPPEMKPKVKKDSDLVSLAEVDPTIQVDLRLVGSNHPFGRAFYRDNIAYLRFGTAKKLKRAQEDLRKQGLGLKIWDAYRPFAVQVAMFEAAGGNGNWVSDPYRTSGKKTHVRAVAVDCTLVDTEGNELPMPTAYLDFAGGAKKMKHAYNDLPADVLANRQKLKETMIACGMEPYQGEWWHYQDEAWANYPILTMDDFPEIHRALLVEELLKQAHPNH